MIEETIVHDFTENGKPSVLPENKSSITKFCEGFTQLKTMVLPPHLWNFILVNAIQFAGMMGYVISSIKIVVSSIKILVF